MTPIPDALARLLADPVDGTPGDPIPDARLALPTPPPPPTPRPANEICALCGTTAPDARIVHSRHHNAWLCWACLDREFKRSIAGTMANLHQRAQQQRNAARDRQWLALCPEHFRRTDPDRLPQNQLAAVMAWTYGDTGMLLAGPTGTGKTRCAWLALKKCHDAGRRIVACDALDFGHQVAQHFGDGSGPAWARYMAQVDVLYLDDLGKVKFTDRVEAELFGLIDRRTTQGRPIIATLNANPTDLAAMFGADRGKPLVRRIRESCRLIKF